MSQTFITKELVAWLPPEIKQVLIDNTDHLMLAGGSVRDFFAGDRDKVKDFDLFQYNKDSYGFTWDALKGTKHKIDLIDSETQYKTPEELLESFDFPCNMIGLVVSEADDFFLVIPKEQLTCDLIQHKQIGEVNLKANRTQMKLLHRAISLIARGWRIDNEQLSRLVVNQTLNTLSGREWIINPVKLVNELKTIAPSVSEGFYTHANTILRNQPISERTPTPANNESNVRRIGLRDYGNEFDSQLESSSADEVEPPSPQQRPSGEQLRPTVGFPGSLQDGSFVTLADNFFAQGLAVSQSAARTMAEFQQQAINASLSGVNPYIISPPGSQVPPQSGQRYSFQRGTILRNSDTD